MRSSKRREILRRHAHRSRRLQHVAFILIFLAVRVNNTYAIIIYKQTHANWSTLLSLKKMYNVFNNNYL